MHGLISVGRRAWAWMIALSLWFLTSPAFLWAQEEGRSRSDPPESKSYVNQYALVIVLVAVALFAVTHTSRRSTEMKANT